MTFTVNQLAGAFGVSVQSMAARLRWVKEDTVQLVDGDLRKGYRIENLPGGLKDECLRRAVADGFPNADLFVHHARPWRPALPLSEVAPEAIRKAEQLRRALAVALQEDRSGAAAAEIEARGVAEWRKVFGHSVTGRYYRKLVKRTKDRAGNDDDWTRLELYLEENPRPRVAPGGLPAADDFRPLAEEIARFGDQCKPTTDEEAVLWDTAFRILELAREGAARKRRKRKLRAFLWRAARPISETENALRVKLERYYARWVKGGRTSSVLMDGREAKKGEPKPGAMAFNELDTERIEYYAREFCGGRFAQGLRELTEMGEQSGLSRELIAFVFAQQSDSKYYSNRRLQRLVIPNIKATMPYRLGGRTARNQRPKLQRLYENLHSMQVVCADDFTWPVYFYIPDGKGWYKLTRGQCLLFIDVRSLRVLNWVLIPAEQYDSLAIRSLMNQVCREFAVPRIWYFERGLWLRSNLVKNRPPQDWRLAHSDSELKQGWEQFGCKFIHATGPQAKPIEKVGDLLQCRMERYQGYCGRDERKDCPDETRRAKLAVEARRELPQKYFFSFEEWEAELGRLIGIYNATVQDGDILRGESPDQVFESNQNTEDPPMRWDAVTSYLGAHYVREFEVGGQGIQFRIGKRLFRYFDAQTGELECRKVLAWFDPANPEYIAVTDLARKNPRLIPMHKPTEFLAVIDPESEEAKAFHNELAKAKAHGSVARNRYHAQKTKFKVAVRQNVHGRPLATFAKEMEAARLDFKRGQNEQDTRRQRITRLLKRLEMSPAAVSDWSADTERHLQTLVELRDSARKEEV